MSEQDQAAHAQAVGQITNARIATQIGNLIISNVQASVEVEMRDARIQELGGLLSKVDAKLAEVEPQIADALTRIDELEAALDTADKAYDALATREAALKERVAELEAEGLAQAAGQVDVPQDAQPIAGDGDETKPLD